MTHSASIPGLISTFFNYVEKYSESDDGQSETSSPPFPIPIHHSFICTHNVYRPKLYIIDIKLDFKIVDQIIFRLTLFRVKITFFIQVTFLKLFIYLYADGTFLELVFDFEIPHIKKGHRLFNKQEGA